MADVLQVCGVAAIGLNLLLANRLWLLNGSVRITTLALLVSAVPLAFASGRLTRPIGAVRALWPWVIMIAVDVGVRVLTGAIHASSTAGALLYSVEASLLPLALLASAYIGYSVGAENPRHPGPMFATVGGITLFVAIAEVLQRFGFSNPVAAALIAWNKALLPVVQVWAPDATEPFRAVALDVDPNFTGAIGVVLLLWGTTWRGRQPRLRAAAVVTGIGIVLLSASRTALIAVIACLLTAGLYVIRRRRAAAAEAVRSRFSWAFLGLLLVTAVVGAFVMVPRLVMVERSVEAVAEAGSVEQGIAAGDGLTSGRLERWSIGLALWRERPFGALQPPEWTAGVSLHNAFLERLVWGGPIMLGVAVFALAWTGTRKFRSAPMLGPAAANVWVVTGLALPASNMPAFACTILFVLGLAAGADASILDARGMQAADDGGVKAQPLPEGEGRTPGPSPLDTIHADGVDEGGAGRGATILHAESSDA